MNTNTIRIKEKEFKKEQLFFLFFAISIILLSLIMKPSNPNQEDDNLSIFGIKTPVICLHRLIYKKPCAGCGLTRSFVSLAHGDIEASLAYHKLGILFFIIVVFQIPIRLYLLRTGISGYNSLVQKLITVPLIIACIALVIHWLVFIFNSKA